MGIQSQALRTLVRLEGMKSSWISIAGRLRHLSTHQKAVPRKFHKGGEQDGQVFLRDPLIDELEEKLNETDEDHAEIIEEVLEQPHWQTIRRASETDYIELFRQWLAKASKFVENLRSKMPGAENA
jgi:guanylate kinase